MDWKQEAVKKLKQLEAKRNSLQNIRAEIAELEADAVSLRGAATDKERISGGQGSDALLNNIMRRGELEEAAQTVQRWIDRVETALNQLTEEERQVLELMYVDHKQGSPDRACEVLHVEMATVYRRRDTALEALTRNLYGVIET